MSEVAPRDVLWHPGRQDEVVSLALEDFDRVYQDKHGRSWEDYSKSLLQGAVVDPETSTGWIRVSQPGDSETDIVLTLGSFSRGNTAMAAGHGAVFRHIVQRAEMHDQAGRMLPVVMLAGPAGNIGTTPEALIAARAGDMGPYFITQLLAILGSMPKLESAVLLGHSFGGAGVPIAALQAADLGLDVRAMGAGAPVTVERRSCSELIRQFLLEGLGFPGAVRRGNHEYFAQAARVEARPATVLKGLLGQRALNLAIGGFLGMNRLDGDITNAYRMGGLEFTVLQRNVPMVVAYGDRDRLTPVKSVKTHVAKAQSQLGEASPISTIEFVEAGHAWSDIYQLYQFAHSVLRLAMGKELAA